LITSYSRSRSSIKRQAFYYMLQMLQHLLCVDAVSLSWCTFQSFQRKSKVLVALVSWLVGRSVSLLVI